MRARSRIRREFLLFVALMALVGAAIIPIGLEPQSAAAGSSIPGTSIQHVVEIMMENHAFDNFFGTYPGVFGFPSNAGVPGVTGGAVRPYWIPGNSTPDLPHDRGSEIADLDSGKMDGFVEEMAKFNASAPDTPMGYYNATQIGGYWALAQEFLLCDMYFQPVIGPTLPNRLYAIAGTSDGVTSDTWPVGGVSAYTIFDELSSIGVSWRYFYQPNGELPIPLNVAPLDETPSEAQDVVPLAGLIPDIRAGSLPAVTFVDPEDSNTLSEHPPQNVTVGEAWSLSIIDAIEQSPDWSSTVIFLTWDEGGGFYDSVVPPGMDDLGDGFRVPMLVVSPFTAGEGISSIVFDHTSVLKFIDQNWGLPYLDGRVAEANSMGLLFHVHLGTRPR